MGRRFDLNFPGYRLTLEFLDRHQLRWSTGDHSELDGCEAILVAPATYFIDVTFLYRPSETLTLIVNTTTGQALSSERYAWQCLVGEQRGHGDVDVASTYKFAADEYLLTFREFKIPVASVFFLNFRERRSTGKFLEFTQEGVVRNSPAGALIHRASLTFYDAGAEPV